jgi:hypothetical protein
LDTRDQNYNIESHYTKEELREIDQYKPVILPDISDDVAEYLRTLKE